MMKRRNRDVCVIRSHFKNRILVQNRGGAVFQTGGILKYFEDLKQGPNKEFGPKDFFEIASIIRRQIPNERAPGKS